MGGAQPGCPIAFVIWLRRRIRRRKPWPTCERHRRGGWSAPASSGAPIGARECQPLPGVRRRREDGALPHSPVVWKLPRSPALAGRRFLAWDDVTTPSDKPPSTGMRTGTYKGRRCCHRSRFNPTPPSFEAAFAQRIYRSTDPSVSASMSRLDKQAAGMAVRSKAISSAGSLHCRPTLRQTLPPGSRLHRSPEDSSALATCPRRSRLER